MPFRLNGKKFQIANMTICTDAIEDDEVRSVVLSVPEEDRFNALKELHEKVKKIPLGIADLNLIRYDFEIKDKKIKFVGGYVAGIRVI